MKNRIYKKWGTGFAFIALLAFSCEEVDGLATPNVASPVLVVVEGSSFPPNSEVLVSAKFMELDKSGILDGNIGIDSIPVNDLEIQVYINQTDEVASLVTNGEGEVALNTTWEDLGLTIPDPGNQVKLEFTGSYKNVSFRKYHTVRVE